uniref:Uncharacterized protein n=1 Tax=Meloidogyne enterolobii TaxID=390850 RepID=A0A6V7TKC1_MELEN|nr:unnamed protein product [Meloidogyne enterolobii]
MSEKESSISDFEFIQSIDATKIENNLDNLQIEHEELKNKYVLLEEKYLSLENKIKIMNEIGLKNKWENGMKTLRELVIECFVQNKNKFKYIAFDWFDVNCACCQYICINTHNPCGVCINGNGFVNLINDGNIKYFRGIVNKTACITAQNSFNKPKEYLTNYSLFYFEIKCKIEGENNFLVVGLQNALTKSSTRYNAREVKIKNGFEEFNLSTFSWNDGDIFGCGLVYPPKKNKLPYVFFTQNGKIIGKAILLNENGNSYIPYVHLQCCSLEINFGNDLKTKPFCYDISKNSVLKEFY